MFKRHPGRMLAVVGVAVLVLVIALAMGPYLLPPSREGWFDFFKTLVGAFAGATAAFLFNLLLQDGIRQRERLAASNYAMATMRRQYVNFCALRNALHEEVERAKVGVQASGGDQDARASMLAETPGWLLARPIVHFLPAELPFDFDKLAFLLEKQNEHVFLRLHHVESLYRSMAGYAAKLNELQAVKQRKMEEAGLRPPATLTLESFRSILGPSLYGEIDAMFRALALHCEKDEADYLAASRALYDALRTEFSEKSLIRPLRSTTPIKAEVI